MEEKIGHIIDYFAKIGVMAVKITNGTLKVGDKIHIKGHTTDFTQIVESMQIEKKPVQQATVGDEIGIKAIDRVRKTDTVYKVIE